MNLHSLCATAVDLHRRGNTAEAERLCLEVLGVERSNFTACYLLGAIRFQQARYADAVQLFAAAANDNPGAAEPHMMRGLGLQALGRYEEALASFDGALARQPAYAEALFNKAVLLGQMGRLEEALQGYDAILATHPGQAVALYNRGVLLGDLKRHEEALESLDRALALRPDFAEAWNNRGVTLQGLGRAEEALSSFDRAVRIIPGYAHAWVNRGVALRELGRPQDALDSFSKAIAVEPGAAEAWNGLGFVQQRLGRLGEALGSFDRALSLEPDYAEALFNRSATLCELDRVQEGFESFARHGRLLLAQAPAEGLDDAPPPHKRRHDEDQRAYLAGLPGGGAASADGGRVAGPALNPASATPEASERWNSSSPQLVVIDDFLSEAALDKLRRFCWGAPIWKTVYENGYLGAMLEAGLACPLLAQIVEEMRLTYPDILGDHPLQYLWAFKYDSRMQGINVHADRAAVNVNFWITADEANLDPDSGGLAVWDAAAPLDWDYETYNADPVAIRRFLDEAGARKAVIPHRANRAVIFDSDLFHETDRIAFRDDYLSRRINITMLFGRRSSDHR